MSNNLELTELGKENATPRGEETPRMTVLRLQKLREAPKGLWICAGIVGLILLIIVVTLVSVSFQYVEWNQYAFKKDTTKNDVDTSKVYSTGRYFWGLGFSAFPFPRTYQNVEFTPDSSGTLVVFTQAALSVQIDCSFQYKLNPDILATLFTKYGVNYNQQVINIARSTLKNVAPQFSTEQYYSQREKIREVFFQTLKAGLYNDTQVEVGWFQLRKVTLSPQVSNKLLENLVQDQVNQMETFVQNATVIRKQTQTLAQDTLANITVLNATANANASLILQQAEIESFKITLQAKQQALAELFSLLGFNSSQQKLSFIYATGLADRTAKTKVIADLNPDPSYFVRT